MPKITMYECDECKTRLDYIPDELRRANEYFCSRNCMEIYLTREREEELKLQIEEQEYFKKLEANKLLIKGSEVEPFKL